MAIRIIRCIRYSTNPSVLCISGGHVTFLDWFLYREDGTAVDL